MLCVLKVVFCFDAVAGQGLSTGKPQIMLVALFCTSSCFGWPMKSRFGVLFECRPRDCVLFMRIVSSHRKWLLLEVMTGKMG